MVRLSSGCARVFTLASLLCSPYLFTAQGLKAQSSGTISGTVLDQASRPVPGAAVSARNRDGQVSGKAASDAEGRFSVELPAGIYSLETSGPGFALNIRRG